MSGTTSPGESPQPSPRRVKAYFELEVIPGLAASAEGELEERFGRQVYILPSGREDRVRFRYAATLDRLFHLRRAVAVARVQHFDIPRPKALLGHENFETLIGLIDDTLALHPPGSFETFYISAAGSDSSVFNRIKREIAARTGLAPTEEMGDLLVAVRRPQRLRARRRRADRGWEVAVRLTPRPLSARSWRVCDMPGALNGTVASTMMGLTHPSPGDRVVNLACGSGTLLIERLLLGPTQTAVGCDVDIEALACAQQNLIASAFTERVRLVHCDAGCTPLPDGWATTVCADLPFGMLIGSHESNETLYPRLLREAARLTLPGSPMVVITQEIRLLERVLGEQADRWGQVQIVPLKLPANTRSGYIRPCIYLLRRR